MAIHTHSRDRIPEVGLRGLFQRARLDEHLPTDHRLSIVYRIGAGLMGVALIVFGVFGVIQRLGFFSTGDNTVAGLNSNGALSWLSIVVGLLLFAGMIKGGNFASSLNLTVGVLFVLSGFYNLAVLETGANFLAFRIQNVLFSFVVGLILMCFGMYGRVSGRLPHDNPYWRARHPEQAAEEDRRHEAAARRARVSEDARAPRTRAGSPPRS